MKHPYAIRPRPASKPAPNIFDWWHLQSLESLPRCLLLSSVHSVLAFSVTDMPEKLLLNKYPHVLFRWQVSSTKSTREECGSECGSSNLSSRPPVLAGTLTSLPPCHGITCPLPLGLGRTLGLPWPTYCDRCNALWLRRGDRKSALCFCLARAGFQLPYCEEAQVIPCGQITWRGMCETTGIGSLANNSDEIPADSPHQPSDDLDPSYQLFPAFESSYSGPWILGSRDKLFLLCLEPENLWT